MEPGRRMRTLIFALLVLAASRVRAADPPATAPSTAPATAPATAPVAVDAARDRRKADRLFGDARFERDVVKFEFAGLLESILKQNLLTDRRDKDVVVAVVVVIENERRGSG